MSNGKNHSRFTQFAKWTSRMTGRPATFIAAVLIIVVWAITGPIFKFSDTWQLVINTGTTIITFLMVFLIQNTQNRDSEALQVKLDELIRAIEGANNALLDLEDLDDKELDEVRDRYTKMARASRQGLEVVECVEEVAEEVEQVETKVEEIEEEVEEVKKRRGEA